ncbi:MAG: hypothetical protein Q8N39_04250 [Pelolinea sp.]|nr:hypothetical protein [Pelolinea sp.]
MNDLKVSSLWPGSQLLYYKEVLPVVFVPLLGQKGWQEKDN